MTPHNIEAEQSVIGALLIDNDSIDRASDLKVEHFYTSDHRAIFAEIKRQISAGNAVDVITVGIALGDKLTDGMAYLNAISQNTPSSANIARYASIVIDSALRRGLIAETSRLADMAVNPAGKTAAQILDSAQTAISSLAETRVKREPILASDALAAHTEVIEARVEKKITHIPTGFSELDNIVRMQRGDLVIVAGRPSMGKTALACNIGTNIADRYGVLVLTQEMSTGQIIDRAVSSVGGIYLSSIISGEMDSGEWDRFTSAAAKIQGMSLRIDDQPALTLLDVRLKAMAVKRKHGLDVLIVDYLQLMSGDGETRNSQIEEISRGLKALAKDLQIVVMALSQLNRTAASGRPRLADLRDSGAIEQDADIVIFVHRDEVNNPDSHLKGIADVMVAKNRQGAITDVTLGYEGYYTRFVNFVGRRPEAPKQTYRRGLAENL